MDLKKIENQIATGEASLLYFSGTHCSVCQSLRPKLEKALIEHFPQLCFLNIDAQQHPEIAASYMVFQVPTMLFFIDGKEYIRKGGNLSVPIFVEQIERLYKLYYR
ncbi:thioredoxin family protein [Mesonia sp. MT50]|uniref:Thioredoxin family protein n=1 Tax=Mesonia profundi TaxID=3070998 RepID=A0ABU0ZZB0_9FLAO|nr:thioredoxin family protein [Mesonia profundi]MDQ7916800.1 thioredoxin family protein [Mesonia profundi]